MIPESNSSVAVRVNIVCKRGDTFKRTFEYYLDEDLTEPIDITASTFKMDVYDTKNKKVILSFREDAGFSKSANKLELLKSAEQMRLNAGIYAYDLEKTTNNEVLTIQMGEFRIEDDTTK